MLTALAAVLTMYPHFPTPTGYVHMGDSIIYIAAAFFGPIAGAVVGGVGHALADLLSGYPVYIPITLVVKAVMGFVTAKILYKKKFTPARLIAAAVVNLVIVTFGYFIPEIFMYGIGSAVSVFISSPVQWLMSIAVSLIIFPAMSKVKSHL